MTIIKVKTGGITADAITSTEIADNAIVTAAINADAVTDAKIADDVVGTEHLTANEVDTTALAADAVTGAQLADDAVNSEHYTDGSIDTAHIADVNVTQGKIADQAINEAKMQISNAPTNGYMLTAQSGNTGGLTWAEASSGGLIKLTTTTLGSNSSAIDFDDTYITSTYTNYYIIGHILPATDNTYLNFQVMTGGSVQSGSSDYGSSAASTGSSNYLTDNDHAQIVLTHTSGGNASGEGVSFFMNLYNPLSTAFSTAVNGICTFENTSGNEEGSVYSGQKRSVEANNGIRFLMNTGNIASGSYVTLYGIKN